MSVARTLNKLQAYQAVSADTLAYGNEAGTFTTAAGALNWIFAALYPNTKDSVDTPADLPLVGNTLNDYRVVLDDGDTKAAGYRWEQREGEASPGWHKIHDMDWSSDAILTAFQDLAEDLYVARKGRQDLDASGNPIAGVYAGQTIYGGAASGQNLTLNANSADGTGAQSGYVQLDGNSRPTSDNAFDLGTSSKRFHDLFLSRNLGDGSVTVTIAQVKAAYDHSLITSGNPHGTSYDALSAKLGTLTLDGDVSGSADLSSSGAKTLTVTVANDSHTHDALSTITNFDTAVYDYLKTALVDHDGLTWVFDDPMEEITPTVNIDSTKISDIDSPSANKILASNAAGNNWSAVAAQVELTGDVTGSAAYNSTTSKWSLATTWAATFKVRNASDITFTNKTITSITTGNPTILNIPSHGMLTGETIRIFGSTTTPSINNTSYTVTKIDANSVSIPVNSSAASVYGYYIPQYAQFLYDPATDSFKIAKEYEDIDVSELSGISSDFATQYALLAGRSSGQSINGGVSASESLTLDSTANSTKGSILFKSKATPNADAAYSGGWSGTDLGSSSKRWNDLYLAGEAKGLRVENWGSLPSSSGTSIGRLGVYSSDLYIDTGSVLKKVGTNDISVVSKSSNYTATAADDVILVNATGGAVNITLPAASGFLKRLTIKKTDASANAVTVVGTIDGATNYSIADKNLSITVVTDQTNWYIT